jgi:phage terminase large subunit GpA-like protein
MEDFPDNRLSEITVMCAAQTGKTQTALALLCWAIAEDPAPALWCLQSADEARQFVRDRAAPTFAQCAAIRAQTITAEVDEFRFASMPLYFVGSWSPARLQGKPIRWLFLDEIRNYPRGAIEMVLKRTRAHWNARRFLISTPGDAHDALHRAYLAGDQRVFHWRCPSCAGLQPLRFPQLKFDLAGSRTPDDLVDHERLAASIRLECPACTHRLEDTPAVRRSLAADGCFVPQNPGAPRNRRSYHWNALVAPWVSWRSVVEEFIAAEDAARDGYLEALRSFVNETLGEPWEDRLGVIEDHSFLRDRCRDYALGDAWPAETVRFLAADRQEAGGEHYFWVVRAFAPGGQSRLIAYGEAATKEELEGARQAQGVASKNAILDTGWRAFDCYRFVVAHRWKAFKGDARPYYEVRDQRGRLVRRLWHISWVDPLLGSNVAGAAGRRVPRLLLFRFAADAAKDVLHEQAMGLSGDWTLPRDTGADYFRHLAGERREEYRAPDGRLSWRWHRKTKLQHWFDCEVQITVAALITRNGPLPDEPSPLPDDAGQPVEPDPPATEHLPYRAPLGAAQDPSKESLGSTLPASTS